jgi:hypothetical protein
MKASIKDFTNLMRVATLTNKPESNRAQINNREIIVTYYPNMQYPFYIKAIEGESYKTAVFSKQEIRNVKNLWNDFIAGENVIKYLY